MQVNINPLIKSRGTRTDLATETKSIGADGRPRLRRGQARWCLVFCSPSGLFYLDPKLTAVTRTWYHQDHFIVTQSLSSTYRDWQKKRHPDTDGN
jgi:hypothetical protein